MVLYLRVEALSHIVRLKGRRSTDSEVGSSGSQARSSRGGGFVSGGYEESFASVVSQRQSAGVSVGSNTGRSPAKAPKMSPNKSVVSRQEVCAPPPTAMAMANGKRRDRMNGKSEMDEEPVDASFAALGTSSGSVTSSVAKDGAKKKGAKRSPFPSSNTARSGNRNSMDKAQIRLLYGDISSKTPSFWDSLRR